MFKKQLNLTSIILVFILVLIWIVSVSRQNSDFDKIIEGMWVAGDDFCKRADIDGMMVYIGPAEGFGLFDQLRRAYIIMHSNGAVIAAKNIELTLSGIILSPVPADVYKTIFINDVSEDKVDLTEIMPACMQCELSISEGRMTWLDGEVAYAELFKMHTPQQSDTAELTD